MQLGNYSNVKATQPVWREKFLWSLHRVFCQILDILPKDGAQIIKHTSEMELYTLEKSECWNLTFLITKFPHVKQSQFSDDHNDSFYLRLNKYFPAHQASL